MAWQTVDTAPRDGTWVLVTGGDVTSAFTMEDQFNERGGPVVSAFYDPEIEAWCYAFWDMDWRSAFGSPSHWMPMPDLPIAS